MNLGLPTRNSEEPLLFGRDQLVAGGSLAQGGRGVRPGRRTLALFPEDRCEVGADDASVVRLRLSEMRLHRRRQWGSAGVVTSDFSQTIENCRSAASPFLLFTMTTTEWSPRPIV
jgi:hypothetical protein